MFFQSILSIIAKHELMVKKHHPLLLLIFSVFFFVVSCAKEKFSQGSFVIQDSVTTKALLQNETAGNSTSSAYVINEDMVREYFKQTSPEKRIDSIEPYTGSGTVPLYIVNFENGWDIVSSDSRSDFVLAKGENGKFELNKIHQGVRVWLDGMIGQIKEFSESASTQVKEPQIWRDIRSKAQKDTLGNRALDPDQEYMWLVCQLSQTDTTIVHNNIPHLLSTKWGQGYPWNTHIPNNRLTGCAATAISQVLYYFHSFTGVPSGLYHSISPYSYIDYDVWGYYRQYLVTRSDYTNNSPRWSQMPLDSLNPTTTTAGYVSDLMFDVGTRLGMIYGFSGLGGSSVTVTNQGYFDISSVNCEYDWDVLTDSLTTSVVNNLTIGKPIIVTSSYIPTTNNNYSGHTWVIDGCYQSTRTITRRYYYVKVPVEDVIDYDENYFVIYRTSTLEDMLRIYPNFVEGTTQQSSTSTHTNYYRMNWGYNGRYDDGIYSMSVSSNWNAYAYGKAIHYNLVPGSLYIE